MRDFWWWKRCCVFSLLRDKIYCTLRFGKFFLRVPLMYQSCCFELYCQGKLGELTKSSLQNPHCAVHFVSKYDSSDVLSVGGKASLIIKFCVWCTGANSSDSRHSPKLVDNSRTLVLYAQFGGCLPFFNGRLEIQTGVFSHPVVLLSSGCLSIFL